MERTNAHVIQQKLLFRYANPPHLIAGVVGDVKGAVRSGHHSDRTAPGSIAARAGHEVFIDSVRLAVLQGYADLLVSGWRGAIP
jgi:hypothetical protein